MLSVSHIKSAKTATEYYTSKDNYYFIGESDSEWIGKGAEELGLEGKVNPDVMTQMFNGILPNDQKITHMISGVNKHRPGYDLTLSAPKSLSVLAVVLDDKQLLNAHKEAVKITAQEIEHAICARVTKDGITTTEFTDKLVAAMFHHDTSRNHDPQIHTHFLVMNATNVDGNWRALATDKIHNNGFYEYVLNNQIAIGKIYQQTLRQSVENLGFITKDVGENGLWEIDNVPVAPFSTRRQEIEKAVGKDASAKSRNIAALDTRSSKTTPKKTDLLEKWQQTLDKEGFNRTEFYKNVKINRDKKKEIYKDWQLDSNNITPDIQFQEAVRNAITLLSDKKDQFTYSDILSNALGYININENSISQIRSAIDDSIQKSQLIPLDKEKGLFTSNVLLLNELTINAFTKKINEKKALCFTDINEAISKTSNPLFHSIIKDKSSLSIINNIGNAITQRKNIEETANAIKNMGRKVTVITPDKSSYTDLTNNLNLTILKRQSLDANFTLPEHSSLIVSNAEKFSLKDISLILEISHNKNIQVFFMNSGGNREVGNGLTVLRQNKIQEYSLSQKLQTSIDVISINDRKERFNHLAQQYATKIKNQEKVYIAASGKEKTTINTIVRDTLKKNNIIENEDIKITTLQPVWLNAKERKQLNSYREGMIVEHWNKENKTLENFTIDRVTPQTNSITIINEKGKKSTIKVNKIDSNWSFYKSQDINISIGEKLITVAKENFNEKVGKSRYTKNIDIKAGNTFIISDISKKNNRLILDYGEKKIAIPLDKPMKLDYNYVETVGKTRRDEGTVLAALSKSNINSATLNTLASAGDSIITYTSLDLEKAKDKIHKTPSLKLVSEKIKTTTNQEDIDKAITTATQNLESIIEKVVKNAVSITQGSEVFVNKFDLISQAIPLHPSIKPKNVHEQINKLTKSGELKEVETNEGIVLVPTIEYEMEKSIISSIVRGKNKVQALIENVNQDHLKGLTKGQQEASRLILKSKDRFTLIQGYAGVGKTTQFKAVIESLNTLEKNHQPEIIGLAPTHRAVLELNSIGVKAQTITSFLLEQNKAKTIEKNIDFSQKVFLIDESSMIGNRDMAELYKVIEEGKGRAILSGDSAQLLAVDSGVPFKLMQERSAIDNAIMKDIVRQTDELRPAIYNIIDNNIKESVKTIKKILPEQVPRKIDAYIPKSSIFEFNSENPALLSLKNIPQEEINNLEAIDLVAYDFVGREDIARTNTIVVAPLNKERKYINNQIHNQLIKNNIISNTETEITILEREKNKKDELKSIAGFSKHKNKIALISDEYFIINNIDKNNGVVELINQNGDTKLLSPFEHSSDDIAIYKERKIKVSVGEKIRFTRSNSELGYIANKEYYISDIDENKQITITDGNTKKILDSHDMNDRHIDYSYAVTNYGSQGASAKYVIYYEGTKGVSEYISSKRSAYVAISRAKEHVQIYTDNSSKWETNISKNKDRKSAHDLLEPINSILIESSKQLWNKAKELSETDIGNKLLKDLDINNELNAKYMIPTTKYPHPHIVFPAYDKNGIQTGVYLDEIRNSNNHVYMNKNSRIFGDQEHTNFVVIKKSQNGNVTIVDDINSALNNAKTPHGVILRLKDDGIPFNIKKIADGDLDIKQFVNHPSEEPLNLSDIFNSNENKENIESIEKAINSIINEDEKSIEQLTESISTVSKQKDEDKINEQVLLNIDLKEKNLINDAINKIIKDEQLNNLMQVERTIIKNKEIGE